MWWCQTGSLQDALQGCDDASDLITAAHFSEQLCLNEVSAVKYLACHGKLQHQVVLDQLRVLNETLGYALLLLFF